MQVLLVVVFGIVERFRGSDFRRDLTFITGRLHRFTETRQAGVGGGLLLWGERVDGRTVLGAVIVTLTHALRRVMVFPEHRSSCS